MILLKCKIFHLRNDDEYDKAIGTLLSIGASVLKVAGEKLLDVYNSKSDQVKILRIIFNLFRKFFVYNIHVVKF